MAQEPSVANAVAQPTDTTQASANQPASALTQTAKIVLEGDGQEFDIPVELAETDELLENALAGAYPDIREAHIERKTENGTLVITISKRSGPKGSLIAAQRVLRRAPRHINPAVALCVRLQELENGRSLAPELLVKLDATIRQAIDAGEAEGKTVAAATAALAKIPPVPSRAVPAGF